MKINLIVLAAGFARRFGSNKLLYEYKGKPLYRHVTDAVHGVSEGTFSRKILVSQYEELLSDPALTEEYCMVSHPDSGRGLSSSIHLGMAASEPDVDAWCFLVCDQPHISSETIEKLVTNWKKSGMLLACVEHNNQLGSPTIFSKEYKGSLLELTGDVGGRRILELNRDDVFLCNVGKSIELQDIDTIYDLSYQF